jgi:hypothetical protein
VEAEQRCCSFLSFTLRVDARGVGLEVIPPEGQVALVTALFGTADPGVQPTSRADLEAAPGAVP